MTAPVAPQPEDIVARLKQTSAHTLTAQETVYLLHEAAETIAAERRGRERVEAEIERLNRQIEGNATAFEAMARHSDAWEAVARESTARIATLEALRKFAKHDATCAVRMIPRRLEPDCSCGFDAALSASDPRVAEPGGKP